MRPWILGLAVFAGLAAPATSSADLPDIDVRSDRDAAYAGTNDSLLTGRSSATPERVALDHARDAFGLTADDIASLKLVARAVSPDGITHLRYNQVVSGIESYDSGLDAHVTRDGRLITSTSTVERGARLPDTSPSVSALAGLGEARGSTDGLALPPRVSKSGRTTTFVTGEAAKLRWVATGKAVRLAWDVYVEGADSSYAVLVDAESGDTLVRKDLTEHIGGARYFPRDPDTSLVTQITMPPSWYDQSNNGTRLWGQYSRTYIDPNDQDPAPGDEQGGTRVQIPESTPGSRDWLYTRTLFPGAASCPVGGCSWDSAIAASRTTNQFQAATNVHVLVGRFSEYLAQAPIGFDEASGNFQRVNASGAGLGNDYIRTEVNDGQGFNNANFATPSDGNAPRMQMYLFTGRSVNGSDVADVVFHEIGHGLSNRLIVNASGSGALNAIQGSMMGEAWSDFYALDLLQSQGWVTDTPGAADVTTGNHVSGANGIRSKPIDCPVAPAGFANCDRNGTATTVLGGYTYGDLARTNNVGGPHNGGEVWAETLWDLRRTVGRDAALALITGGMRLTRDNPSMLDARDAILQQAVAMRSAPGAPDDYFAEAWEVFRARGMGIDATTTGAADTAPVESFSAPRNRLSLQAPVVSDPYPGGDNDGRFEAGERIEVSAPVSSAGVADLPGVTGTLTSPIAAIEDGSATWALLGNGRTAANADALVARMPAACGPNVPLTIAVTSPEGTINRTSVVSTIPSSRTVVAIADRPDGGAATVTQASYVVSGGGTITDVNAHIADLRHSFLGDLTIELIHDGETVMLFNPPDGLSAADLDHVVFDSDSLTPVFSAGAGPATGTMRPQDATGLNRFDGHPAAGTWTLRITDLQSGDAGVLSEWGVHGAGFPCSRLEIPAASTGGAGQQTTDSAVVSGAVTPNGRATGLRFVYGTTAAYGAASATQDVGAGDAAVPGSASLTGLAPGTTYHYRVEAIRESGAVAMAGADMTFTTAQAPVVIPTASPTPPAGDRTAPAFSGRPKVKLAKAGKKNRRATFSFTLSEAARVNAVVTVAAKGIRKGSKCVAVPRRKPKGARNCTRQVNAARGSATLAKAGAGKLVLPKKGLGKGRYSAVLTAVDSAGNQSKATVTFTIR